MTTVLPLWLEVLGALGGLGGIVAAVTLVPKGVKWWRGRKKDAFEVTIKRTAYGSAHVLIRNRGPRMARLVSVRLRYSNPESAPKPLERPFKIKELRPGDAPVPVPFLFLPEVGQPPLIVTITQSDARKPRSVHRVWWPPWPFWRPR